MTRRVTHPPGLPPDRDGDGDGKGDGEGGGGDGAGDRDGAGAGRAGFGLAGALAGADGVAAAERLRGTAHPAPGAVGPGGWLAAAPSVSRTCWPYLASLASPMPLTVPSSARVAGDCAAIWRSVASWKIT